MSMSTEAFLVSSAAKLIGYLVTVDTYVTRDPHDCHLSVESLLSIMSSSRLGLLLQRSNSIDRIALRESLV